ncbi:MAG: hypothetical protein KME20_26855 [Kaiparowitsia implicata GSE-PSE-MK54-09C]|jgi:hypothetical protein|nr:hypothetical protein [Kaiparowitsia implicata GSE-PSE-MK54-09C]
MTSDAIDKKRLERIFIAMDDAAASAKRDHQILCIFGAAAILSYGSNERQTEDIDIWRPASKLNDRALRQMAEAAGLDFNPTELEPDKAYLQVIDDGVVQMPSFDAQNYTWSNGQKSETLWSGDALTIVAPPPAIVAAAKMVRANPQDIEDVAFLMNVKSISTADITIALRHFPQEARHKALENMIMLDLAIPSQLDRPLQKGRDDGGYGR